MKLFFSSSLAHSCDVFQFIIILLYSLVSYHTLSYKPIKNSSVVVVTLPYHSKPSIPFHVHIRLCSGWSYSPLPLQVPHLHFNFQQVPALENSHLQQVHVPIHQMFAPLKLFKSQQIMQPTFENKQGLSRHNYLFSLFLPVFILNCSGLKKLLGAKYDFL